MSEHTKGFLKEAREWVTIGGTSVPRHLMCQLLGEIDSLTAKAALLEEAVAALKSALWLMGKDSDRAIIKEPPHSTGQLVQALRDALAKVREKGG